jgi:transcription elongation regulator 1
MCCVQDISYSTDYDSFAKLWGHEPRFESLEHKDRESLLNERCAVNKGKR